jgi:hypothetical protein
MIIYKYIDFIKEGLQDPPEEWIKNTLLKVKKSIEDIFNKGESIEEYNPDNVESLSNAIERGKNLDKDKSLTDLGVELTDIELSKYSAEYDSLKVIFTDGENRYDLYITIPLKLAIESKKNDNSYDIKDCFIKFKKYNFDMELSGSIPPKKVKISDINEDFFIELKIELDSDSDEEFEIN